MRDIQRVRAMRKAFESFRKSIHKCAIGMLAVVWASGANAGLIGVNTIEISNAINEWLQVAEFEIYDLSNVNVALTGTASAPDSWNVFSTPDKAIDGNRDGVFNNQSLFHEGNPRTGDTLLVTLLAPTDISGFSIFGRTDCCSARDVYNITFRDANGSIIQQERAVDATGAGNSASVSYVPTPAPLALMFIGLCVLGARRLAYKK